MIADSTSLYFLLSISVFLWISGLIGSFVILDPLSFLELPLNFFISILLLSYVGICLILRDKENKVILILFTLSLISFIQLTPRILEGGVNWYLSLRTQVAFWDISVSRTILVRDWWPAIQWPGIFLIFSPVFLVSELFRHENITFIILYPLFFWVLLLPILYRLGELLTRDFRIRWLFIWFFYIGFWVKQDYFAPQSVGIFLLLIFFILIFRGIDFVTNPSSNHIKKGSLNFFLLLCLLLLLFFTHFLTFIAAFFITVGYILLLIVQSYKSDIFSKIKNKTIMPKIKFIKSSNMRIIIISLGIIGVVMCLWFFLYYSLQLIRYAFNAGGGFLDLPQIIYVNLIRPILISSSEMDRFLAISSRIFLSGFFFCALCLEVFFVVRKARRTKVLDTNFLFIFLTILPMFLVLLTQYGYGEIFSRVFLFTLVPMAYACARLTNSFLACFTNRYGKRGILKAGSIIIMLFFIINVHFIAHYGNDNSEVASDGFLKSVDFFANFLHERNITEVNPITISGADETFFRYMKPYGINFNSSSPFTSLVFTMNGYQTYRVYGKETLYITQKQELLQVYNPSLIYSNLVLELYFIDNRS